MKNMRMMKTASSFQWRGAWVLAAAMFLAHQAAQACPGCQQANTENGKTALNGISVGFGFGVVFLLVTVFGVLGTLGYVMYRSCRIIAAQQQAAMDEEDAGRGGLSYPVGSPA